MPFAGPHKTDCVGAHFQSQLGRWKKQENRGFKVILGYTVSLRNSDSKSKITNTLESQSGPPVPETGEEEHENLQFAGCSSGP